MLVLTWCLHLALTTAAAAERPQVALVNATAEADRVEVFSDGSARLSGRVILHVEQLGAERATADITADLVTVVVGQARPTGDGARPRTMITKIFARGSVHIQAMTHDPAQGETRTVVSDCDRAEYLAADEVVHFYGPEGGAVTARVHIKQVPTEANKLDAPQEYDLDLTARRSLDYRLTGQPAEAEAAP